MAAVGKDGAAVIDQPLQGAAFQGVGEVVAGQGDAEGFGGGKQGFALWRADGAAVGDDGRDEGDGAAGRNGDVAEVFDAAAGGAVKAVVARHEVFVADAGGGGDQAADIDLCILADEDAVRVLDEDVSVGVHRAFEDGALVTEDAVQGDGVGIGLVEIDGFLRRGAEALPVDGSVLAALLDIGDVALLGNGGLSGADFAAGGCGAGGAAGKQGGD